MFRSILAMSAFATCLLAQSPAPESPFTVGPYWETEIAGFTLLQHITNAQREKGLSYVRVVPPRYGMVIAQSLKKPTVFSNADWVSDTDLVFIGEKGNIQKVLAAKAPMVGGKESDQPRFTADGPMTEAEAQAILPKLPLTRFVVALRLGDGQKFVKVWKKSFWKRLANPDKGSRAYGWEK